MGYVASIQENPPALPCTRRVVRPASQRSPDLDQHPFIRALGPDATRLTNQGRIVTIADRQLVDTEAPRLRLVLRGGLGSFADIDHLCVSWRPAGSAQGLHHIIGGAGAPIVQGVLNAVVFEVPACAVLAALDRHGAVHLLGSLVAQRLEAAEADTASIGLHTVEIRLIRWLLRLSPQAPGLPLRLTHERLSQLLGVQRSTISGALMALREQGAIQSGRGQLTICDRPMLARLAREGGGTAGSGDQSAEPWRRSAERRVDSGQ